MGEGEGGNGGMHGLVKRGRMRWGDAWVGEGVKGNVEGCEPEVCKFHETRLCRLELLYGQQCTPKHSLCCPQWTHSPNHERILLHLLSIMYIYRVMLTGT